MNGKYIAFLPFQGLGKTILLLVIPVFTLLSACGPTKSPTLDAATRHPFSLVIGVEDGAQVSLGGYTVVYRPETSESLQIDVRNNTERPWNGRLCVQLLKPFPAGVVVPLIEKDFTLDSGEGFDHSLGMNLPANLLPGTYGLAFVVYKPVGPVVDVIFIQVGEGDGDGQPMVNWPVNSALEACPDPIEEGQPSSNMIIIAGMQISARNFYL